MQISIIPTFNVSIQLTKMDIGSKTQFLQNVIDLRAEVNYNNDFFRETFDSRIAKIIESCQNDYDYIDIITKLFELENDLWNVV